MNRVNSKIEGLLNAQIKMEYESSMLYQKIAQCLEFNGWFGAAKLFKKYSDEEQSHAKMLMDFMQDVDCEPEIPTINSPKFEFKDIEQVAKAIYDHEIKVTDSINNIAISCLVEKDMTTHTFIQKLVAEQIEELQKSQAWVDRINIMKQTSTPLFSIDEEMGNKAS